MAPLNNKYFFLRHGHSLANEADVITSTIENGIKAEYKLSAKGIEQAKEGGEKFKKLMESMPGKPVYFVNSPFYRAKETGAIVASAIGIKEDSPNFEINNDLRERFFGKDLELKKSSEHYPLLWKEDEASKGTKGPGPDGESANAVAERIQGVVKGLEAKHKGAVIVLSAHGDICTIGLATLTGGDVSTHFKNGLANCELRPVN